MTFLRSNHIKELTSSYGMHARCPGTLKRSRKLAWWLFLSVLALLPAGGSSQLTQCNVKLQETLWWRLNTHTHHLHKTQWQHALKKRPVSIQLRYLQCTLIVQALAFFFLLMQAFKPIRCYFESFLFKQKRTLDLSHTKGNAEGRDSCILHHQWSIIPVTLAGVGQMAQWLQQGFCWAIICCYQQILLSNQFQMALLTIISEWVCFHQIIKW